MSTVVVNPGEDLLSPAAAAGAVSLATVPVVSTAGSAEPRVHLTASSLARGLCRQHLRILKIRCNLGALSPFACTTL